MTVSVLPLLAALAAPPPPPLTPPGLPERVGEFRTAGLLQGWAWHVAQRKGPLTRDALAKPPNINGFKPAGRFLEMEGRDFDYGPVSASDMQRMCPVEPTASGTGDGCITVVRFAVVPQETYEHGSLGKWVTGRFSPIRLASILKSRGITPDAPANSDNKVRQAYDQFAREVGADAKLSELLEVRQVDSRTCPALAQATLMLEGSNLSLRMDLPGVKEDALTEPVPPHAFQWRYRWTFTDGGWNTLEGTGQSAAKRLAEPLVTAAAACGLDRPQGGALIGAG